MERWVGFARSSAVLVQATLPRPRALGVDFLEGALRGDQVLDSLGRQISEKAAGQSAEGLPGQLAPAGATKENRLRARGTATSKVAALFDRAVVVDAALAREGAFFQPGDEHHVEIQTVRGADRHERGRASSGS